jgi:ABC-type multidrug transport system fused ATPase/permease subunit
MNKIIDSLLGLDELSSNLSLVNENVKTLQKNNENQQVDFSEKGGEKFEYQRGKDLVFENVTFAYPERSYRDILIDFSFRFKKGKIYGIAGQNGIGKSTITKTTLKLYEAKKGRIKIGGRDIRNINTKDLQKNICHQTNRPNFFNMSIAENVFYPNVYIKERDYEIMLYAARKACIDEFILKLSKGFDTVLKEGGTDLSEGQKQQISAMKIFIDEYDLYILDEILSNVHPLIRRRILDNIFKKVSGKTVLVIDHHYEIFKYVDEIYKFTGRNLLKENGIMIEKEKAKEKQNE